MGPLDQKLRRCRWNPATLLVSAAMACAVFVSMGLTQLNLTYTQPEEDPPLTEFHLPPPPPPPEAETPPKKTPVSINFDVPVTSGPADVPLGFLNVDFGLSPKQLTETRVNINEAIESFQTDGLEDLTIYDYKEVTEKPIRTYRPPLDVPPRATNRTNKPFSFIAIFRVAKNGHVSDAHIIDCPFPDAIPYLEKWLIGFRYKPAKKEGEPVDCLTRVRITYTPSTASSPFSL